MKETTVIRWSILFILIVTPLWFFTDLTRNPYYTQIMMLNVGLVFVCMMSVLYAIKSEVFVWKKTPLDYSLFGFFLVASISIAWAWVSHPYLRSSIYSETTKRWIYLLVNCYAAYYIAVWYVNDTNRKRYLDISIAVGMIAAGYGIVQYFGIEIIWPRVLNPFGGRSVSTFGNPNFLSSFLVLLLPLSMHYLFEDRHGWRLKIGDWVMVIVSGIFLMYLYMTRMNRDPSVDSVVGCFTAIGVLIASSSLRKGKIWYIAATMLFVGSLLCSLTRSSWVGAFVGLALFVLGLLWTGKFDKKMLAAVVIICFFAVYFWPKSKVAGYQPSVLERFIEVKQIKEGLYAPLHQRVLIWRCALSMTEQFPVLGVGWGNFELYYPFYQGAHMVGTFFKQFRTHANNSHNEILEILSQVGLVGFGMYILIIASICAVLWKNRSFLYERYGLLPLALFAGAAGMWVDNLLNVSLHFAVPGFQHWWQFGILAGMLSFQNTFIPVKTRKAKILCFGIIVWCICLCVRAVMFQLAEVHFFKGFKFSKGGLLAQAIPELEKARKFHPLEVNNNYELGNCYARMKNRKKALFAYEEALKSNAGYDEIYFNLAAVYLQMKDKKNAIAYYEKAVSINPTTLDTYLALGNMYLEDLPAHGEKLVALYKQGLLFYPDNKDIWNNLGYVYTKADQHELAMDAYAAALKIDPNFELAKRNLAVALKTLGKDTHPLLEREKDLKTIETLVKKNDLPGALKLAQDMQKTFPDDPTVLVYLANINFNMGSADKAEEIFLQVLQIDPKNITALNNLGITYMQTRRAEEAQKRFNDVLAIEPNNKIAKENLARLQVK